MSEEKSYDERIAALRQEVLTLDDESSSKVIEETAVRLRGLNFTAPLVTPVDRFLRLRREGVLAEIDRIMAMSEAEACALAPDNSSKCEDLRVQYITVLIFYYRKLLALRQGSSEEWDEIDELYVHD